VSNDADSVHESGLQGLVIDTNDPGPVHFAMRVGAIRNVSSTPLDGSQDMSFRESTIGGELIIDGDEDNRDLYVPGHDPNDPDVIAMLTT